MNNRRNFLKQSSIGVLGATAIGTPAFASAIDNKTDVDFPYEIPLSFAGKIQQVFQKEKKIPEHISPIKKCLIKFANELNSYCNRNFEYVVHSHFTYHIGEKPYMEIILTTNADKKNAKSIVTIQIPIEYTNENYIGTIESHYFDKNWAAYCKSTPDKREDFFKDKGAFQINIYKKEFNSILELENILIEMLEDFSPLFSGIEDYYFLEARMQKDNE